MAFPCNANSSLPVSHLFLFSELYILWFAHVHIKTNIHRHRWPPNSNSETGYPNDPFHSALGVLIFLKSWSPLKTWLKLEPPKRKSHIYKTLYNIKGLIYTLMSIMRCGSMSSALENISVHDTIPRSDPMICQRTQADNFHLSGPPCSFIPEWFKLHTLF